MRAAPFRPLRATLSVALLAVAALAGCVQAPAEGTLAPQDAPAAADPWNGFPDPFLLDHDHTDLAQHALTTPTMEALYREAFRAPHAPSAVFAEIDLLGEDHLVLASLFQGFHIVDVRDRAKPVPVSFSPDPGFVGDVKASDSGNFVFVGIQLAGFTGVHAWNVAVKERPFLAGAFPMDGGCHMLAYHREHLYCAPNDATVRIFRVTETSTAAILEPVGAYAPQGAPPAPVLLKNAANGDEMTHDMTVQDDPLTGEPVMLVSFWDYGVRVVDVADPASPVELGAWAGAGAEGWYEGNVHTAMAALVDGRRVVATVPEYALLPSVTLLDAADYANMSVLGAWLPKPESFGTDNPNEFSTHNFQLVEEKIYVANYHGGIVVLDVADPAAPRVSGYHLPHEDPAFPLPGRPSPSTWDVVLKDGHIYASDMVQGLHVLHHTPDVLGAGGPTSFA